MLSTLTDSEIDAFLMNHTIGSIGCCLNGKPYVFPMAYVYHDDVIYGQTTIGKKIEAARKSPLVCFESFETTEQGWQSIMCWGTFEELEFSDLKAGTETAVVSLLTQRLESIQHRLGVEVPFKKNGTISPGIVDGKEATLFHIVLEDKSGRRWQKQPYK